jgi:hypothetical protein
MVRHSLTLGVAVLLLASRASAQVTFIKTWDWFGNSRGLTVHQLDDDGYVVGALVAEPTDLIASALIRTDSLGDTLWTCVLSLHSWGFVCQTVDNDFVLITDTLDGLTGWPYVAATKVGRQGRIQWSRFYPPSGDRPWSVWPTADGGVVVCGKFADGGVRGAGLIKLDAQGALQWEKVLHLGADAFSSAHAVQQTQDGGYVVSGRLDFPDDHRLFVARIDRNGDTVWTRSDVARSESQSVCQTSDGGFVATGSEYDSVRCRPSVYLVKYDRFGVLLWHRRYGTGTGGYWGYCVRQARDGGFVVAGVYEAVTGEGHSAMVLRTDPEGDSLWLREYVHPSGFLNIFLWVEQAADGGYVMTGEVDYTLVLLVKTDSLGLVYGGGVSDWCRGRMSRPRVQTTFIARGMLTYQAPTSSLRPAAEMVDITGRKVMDLRTGENDIRHLAPGVYLVRLADDGDASGGGVATRSAVHRVVVTK